jgi:hypothetical protein
LLGCEGVLSPQRRAVSARDVADRNAPLTARAVGAWSLWLHAGFCGLPERSSLLGAE